MSLTKGKEGGEAIVKRAVGSRFIMGRITVFAGND
jgi:hypothetical protein